MKVVSSATTRLHHLVPLLAVQGVGLVCGLISVRWSSALVPPEVLGTYGLLLGTQLFGVTVTHHGFVKHVQQHWAPFRSGRSYARLLLGHNLAPTLWLAAGLALVFLLLRAEGAPALPPVWWVWMLATNLGVVAAHVFHAALQAEERYWAHFVLSTVGSATRSFLPLLAFAAWGGTAGMMGAGFLAHALLWPAAGAWLLSAAWNRAATVEDANMESPDALIGAFMGVGLLGWLGVAAPRWFAAVALGPVETGYFMLALNLTLSIPAAVSLIGQSYSFPILFQSGREGATTGELLAQTERTLLAALIVGQASLLLLHSIGLWLVGPLISSKYGPSTDWLLAAGGASLATISSGFYCNLLLSRKRERACLWLTLGSAVLRLSVMALLATAGPTAFRWGLAGLAWPTVALEASLARWLIRSH